MRFGWSDSALLLYGLRGILLIAAVLIVVPAIKASFALV